MSVHINWWRVFFVVLTVSRLIGGVSPEFDLEHKSRSLFSILECFIGEQIIYSE